MEEGASGDVSCNQRKPVSASACLVRRTAHGLTEDREQQQALNLNLAISERVSLYFLELLLLLLVLGALGHRRGDAVRMEPFQLLDMTEVVVPAARRGGMSIVVQTLVKYCAQ